MDQNASNVNIPEIMPADNGVIEIDLGEILGVLLHRLWLIVLVAAICGAGAYSFSKFVLPEKFESTTRIYVLDKDTEDNSSVYTDLQVGSQLTKDYAELITSRYVLETVIKNMKLSDQYDYDDFLKKVDVTTPVDTRIVKITVTDTDPKIAQTMADMIREVASRHIENVMSIDAVNVVDEANYPYEKSFPNCGIWAVAGAAAGMLLLSIILIIHFLVDDSIKTSEDVERYLGISALGIIPFDENVTADIGTKNGKKESKKKSSSAPSTGSVAASATN
jgi:capsular polysaccharide biosynthesis protein